MDNEWISVNELAERWNLTPRRVNQLCKENHLAGVYKKGRSWRIPSDIEKPVFLREKSADYLARAKTPLLPCPVGVSDYIRAQAEYYYVDKTEMIRDFLDEKPLVSLFTRPRRFGKSLNMDMLKVFFEKTEKDTSIYFKDKKIWTWGTSYTRHQGRYPLIFLSFKDANAGNWEMLRMSLCMLIRQEYQRHLSILDQNGLNPYDRAFFQAILDDTASLVDYQFSLGRLAHMLRTCYGEKVVVIIDEYDTPIQKAHLGDCYPETIDFIRNLFSAVLKDNEDLAFGILTGILRIAKESMFSGLNNLMVNTILDEPYSQYFGFTPSEVDEIASYYRRKGKLAELKSWYNGYRFASREIYNPWSVINYFQNDCRPRAYWVRTSGNEIIGQLISSSSAELQEHLTQLLQGQEVKALIDTNLIYPEIPDEPNTIFSFLLMSGYLRITDTIATPFGRPICSLAIPNQEIRCVFHEEIQQHHRNYLTNSLLMNFQLALLRGDATLFQNTLRAYLLQSASYFDTAEESFYHGTIFGMLAVMSDTYYISSNREAGEGRFDVELMPHHPDACGYLIEFKAEKMLSHENSGDAIKKKLQAKAKEAIAQIKEKQYATNLQLHGVKQIGLFGLACFGKQVAVEFEYLNF